MDKPRGGGHETGTGSKAGTVTPRVFRFRQGQWGFGDRTYILGIINVTPDSFSDGKPQAGDPAYQVQHAADLLKAGADGLDIGAESTRPGSTAVPADEEWRRLFPVLRAVRQAFPEVPLSIDTYKASVAERALNEGADIINDVWGFSRDPDMARVVARGQAGAVVMFNASDEADRLPSMVQMRGFFQRALTCACKAGLTEDQVVIDPGVGFRIRGTAIWPVLTQLATLTGLGSGILVGHSRKRFLGAAAGVSHAAERDLATAVLSGFLVLGGADVLRVHDPAATRQAIHIAQHWRTAGGTN